MARRMKVEPVGEAETKRVQRRADVETKLAEAQAELTTAQQELAEATEAMLAIGVNADSTKRDEAQKRVEHVEMFIQRYRTEISVYDRDEAKELCKEWDTRQNSVESYLATLEELRPEVEEVASQLVALMVRARDAHAEANETANDVGELVKELAGYGIRVREPRPSLVAAQQLIALALRKALLAADLAPTEHFAKESLAPAHYTPPEGKEQAA